MIFTTFAIFPPELKRGFLSLVQQYADYRHIERNTNITIFHIWNGYMKLTTQSTVFSKFCHLWLKSNITVFQTCWYLCFVGEYQRFHTRYNHPNILDSLPNKKAWTFNVNPRFVFYRSKWTITAAWFRFGKVKHINKRLIHRPTTSHVMSREHSLIFGSSVYNYFFDLFFVDSVNSHYNPHR